MTDWDGLLGIRTYGRDDSVADRYHYPYEPTPYCVLERLAGSGGITKENTLIDYGCGKGRVSFYMTWQTRCRSVGIEYDERLYQRAIANLASAAYSKRIRFELAKAETYQVPRDADRFYFFNPFSPEILRKTTARILESWYEIPREIRLYFYYPSDEYVAYLMTVDELVFADEIDCRDLFAGNDQRERILIFRAGY